jgi:phosphatidylinositol phospholipase C delta
MQCNATQSLSLAGLNKKEQYEASHIVSLGERRANKIMKESRKELISHCRTHLIRSYPAGTRFFTSSNYLPIFYWSVGIQLVSLNWQTYDLGMEINMSFFNRNGRCGFVLKPDLLRFKKGNEKDSSALTSATSSGGGHGTGKLLGGIIGSISNMNQNEKDKEAIKKLESYVLEIEILSAQQLPRPRLHDPSTTLFTESDSTEKQLSSSNIILPINPFVEVMVFTPTIPKDDISTVNKYKTDTVLGNGFNPVFSSTTSASTSTSSPEGSNSNAAGGGKFKIPFTTTLDGLDLAFLRVEVLAKVGGEEMSLGKYTVSLPVLMPGECRFTLFQIQKRIPQADEKTLFILPIRLHAYAPLGYRHIPLYDHLGQQYLFSSLFIYTRLHKLPG